MNYTEAWGCDSAANVGHFGPMTRHDATKELGAVCSMRMEDGVCYLIDIARRAPGEIHLFEVPDGPEKVSVVVAVSAEARAKLEQRLTLLD
jgi:hypothetical protein